MKLICKDNRQLATYFGYDNGKSLKIQDNHKVSDVKKLLLNHSNIKRVQDNPIVLKWFDEVNLTNLTNLIEKIIQIKKKIIKKILMKVDQNSDQIRQIRQIQIKNLSKDFNLNLR